MESSPVLAGLFSVAGAAMLAGSVLACNRTCRFLRASSVAPGTVTDVVADDLGSPDGELYYFVVVEFVDEHGCAVRVRWSTGTVPPLQRAGDTVTVRYDRTAPHRASPNTFLALWHGFLALLGVGAAFTGGGLRLLVAGG